MSAILDPLAAVTTPDGNTSVLKTAWLSETDAILLGEYESWLSQEKLYRKLYCRDCGPSAEMEVLVEPTQIGLACAHRLLLFQGLVPMRLTNHLDLGEPVTIERLSVPDVPIHKADAFMLMRYRGFLLRYALQEGLWCLKCEDEGNPSGLKAYVKADNMVLLCRCQRRMFNEAVA